jgi:hypothetical protein
MMARLPGVTRAHHAMRSELAGKLGASVTA